jgi:hypothetical protein
MHRDGTDQNGTADGHDPQKRRNRIYAKHRRSLYDVQIRKQRHRICSLTGQSLLLKFVEGKGQGCLMPRIETPAKLHLSECPSTKSHLSLGGSPGDQTTLKGNFNANLLRSGGVEEPFSV